MKKLFATAAVLTIFGVVPAFADSYYIVREKGQKECRWQCWHLGSTQRCATGTR